MAVKSKGKRLQKLEEQLEEQIKQKKQALKNIERQIQIDIGKSVMKHWEIEDEVLADKVIQELSEQAKEKYASLL